MRYQVPQFIEVEDKIFGPLTLKQFLYLASGSALGFILWSTLPKFIAAFVAIPILLFALALAFYKYNSRSLIYTVESAVKYFFASKLYIWKKRTKKPVKKEVVEQEEVKLDLPKLSDSKLKELTWSLDVNQNLNKVDNNNHNFKI
jgi:phosphate/sulfate permease